MSATADGHKGPRDCRRLRAHDHLRDRTNRHPRLAPPITPTAINTHHHVVKGNPGSVGVGGEGSGASRRGDPAGFAPASREPRLAAICSTDGRGGLWRSDKDGEDGWALNKACCIAANRSLSLEGADSNFTSMVSPVTVAGCSISMRMRPGSLRSA